MYNSDDFGRTFTQIEIVNPWCKKIKDKPNDPWTQPTKRCCLRCTKEFVAKGKYLRFCPTCRSLNATTYNNAETFKIVDACRFKDYVDDFQTNNQREKNESRTDIQTSTHQTHCREG